MTTESLTQKQVRKLFNYDPDTGIFTRLVAGATRAKAGEIVSRTNKDGYPIVKVNSREYRLHRLVFLYVFGDFPPDQVDHKNHVRTDNRLSNLRLASNVTNGKNQSKRSSNTSGVTGVYWDKRTCKWVAFITKDGRKLNLGRYYDKKDAMAARRSAEVVYEFHANHGL